MNVNAKSLLTLVAGLVLTVSMASAVDAGGGHGGGGGGRSFSGGGRSFSSNSGGANFARSNSVARSGGNNFARTNNSFVNKANFSQQRTNFKPMGSSNNNVHSMGHNNGHNLNNAMNHTNTAHANHGSTNHDGKHIFAHSNHSNHGSNSQHDHHDSHHHGNHDHWKSYCGGWGSPFCCNWGWGCGWGWGCWNSPWCGGWGTYECCPVVSYCNPYCGGVSVVDGFDYSTPISQLASAQVGTTPVATDGPVPTDNPVQSDPQQSSAFEAARQAFLQGDFNTAMQQIAVAVQEMPTNRDVHQMHSLILFAMGDYHKSAAVAHVALQDGPGWSWDTVQQLYSSPEIYAGQLRGLEKFVNENASAADARFLLGYHYLMMNHVDAAKRQLQQVVEMEPKDQLSPRILQSLNAPALDKAALNPNGEKPVGPDSPVVNPNGQPNVLPNGQTPVGPKGKDEYEEDPTPQQKNVKPNGQTPAGPKGKDEDEDDPTPQQKNVKSTTPDQPANDQPAQGQGFAGLVGTWKAQPAKGVQIELGLRPDGAFTWKFNANGEAKAFSGKYRATDKSLVLNRDGDGQAMEGEVKLADNGFQFRMKDAEAADPGLSFTKGTQAQEVAGN